MARVCPTTPPAPSVKRDQLVPNWNSRGMPVTTPKTKVRPKTLIQKRAARLDTSQPRRSARVLSHRMSSASPMDTCGNR